MNKRKTDEMNHYVVKFLSQYGNLPVIKEVDEHIKKAKNKLLKLQAGVKVDFIKVLKNCGRLLSGNLW